MPPGLELGLTTLGILVLAGLAGWAVDVLAVAAVRRASARHHWVGGNTAARALRGLPTAWALLGGAYLAVVRAELSTRAETAALKWLYAGAVVVATIAAVRLAAGLVRLYSAHEDTALPSTTIFVNLTRLVVIAIGILIALGALGVSVTPLLTALGVGGLAVALALQDTLGNLFAGLNVIGSKKVRPGDFIRIVDSGVEGTVVDITWRYTSLRQPSNNTVVVPNSTLATSTFVNFSRPEPQMSVVVEVPLAPGADVSAARHIAEEAATEVMRECPEAAAGAEPTIRLASFAAGGVTLSVALRAREYAGQWALRDELLARLHERFAAEGVELASLPAQARA